jgi:diadenosine tetraphosphatase ApaH/serine/threonine PP2A family protein phosphatase
MLIAIVSDIHSNLIALEAVLEQLPAYDQLWCLGDTIGYGPQPNECLQYMRDLATYTLTGNHDLGCLGKLSLADFNDIARIANEWNGKQLSPDLRAFLDTRPPAQPVEHIATLAHASPRDPVWEYIDTLDIAQSNLNHFSSQICFVGHTHIPMRFARYPDGRVEFDHMQRGSVVQLQPGARYIVNPGSVGQPRDQNPQAAYVLWDTAAGTIRYERIGYDVAATQKRILAAGLPAPLAERLELGS